MDKHLRANSRVARAVVALLVWWAATSPLAVAAEAEQASGGTGAKVACVQDGGLWVRALPASRPERLWTGAASLWLYGAHAAAVHQVAPLDAPPHAWFGYYG